MRIGKKKKKETPPQKKVKRLKVILAIMAVMLAVILIPQHKDRQQPARDASTMMEETLDSLMSSLGFDGGTVTYRGTIEYVLPSEEDTNATHLAAAQRSLQMVSSITSLPKKQLDALIAEAQAKYDSILAVMEANTSVADIRGFHSRRIRLTTQEGKRYTFLQRLDSTTGLSTAAYVKELKENK